MSSSIFLNRLAGGPNRTCNSYHQKVFGTLRPGAGRSVFSWRATEMLVVIIVLAATTIVPALAPRQSDRSAPTLAPFVPTPQPVVDRMLALAAVTAKDVVYDLGSGDGRIVITAAQKFGARGVGIEIDPRLIAESLTNARTAGVEELVTFKLQDALTADVSEATVVTLYLLSASNVKLRPRLTRQLRKGARIVSHGFSMGEWRPDKVDTFTDDGGIVRTLYLWKADGVVR